MGLGRDWFEGALGRGADVGDLKSGSLPSPAAVAEIEKKMQEKIKGNFIFCSLSWKNILKCLKTCLLSIFFEKGCKSRLQVPAIQTLIGFELF